MIKAIDHVIVAVSDLRIAEKDYIQLLGSKPVWKGSHPNLGTSNVLFNFENTYLELLAADGQGIGADFVNNKIENEGEGLIGLVLGADNIDLFRDKLIKFDYQLGEKLYGEGRNETNLIRKWSYQFLPPELTRNLFLFIIEHEGEELPLSFSNETNLVKRLEQVVIKTNDADGFINIYKDTYGIRLALDSVIREWNRRMLFFRLNHTTLEVIEEKDKNMPASDKLWGLSWGVDDIVATRKRLIENGIEISEIKEGIKENTLVATIKSHTHNIPTLLIQHTR